MEEVRYNTEIKADAIKYVAANFCKHECPAVGSQTCKSCPILHNPRKMRDHEGC